MTLRRMRRKGYGHHATGSSRHTHRYVMGFRPIRVQVRAFFGCRRRCHSHVTSEVGRYSRRARVSPGPRANCGAIRRGYLGAGVKGMRTGTLGGRPRRQEGLRTVMVRDSRARDCHAYGSRHRRNQGGFSVAFRWYGDNGGDRGGRHRGAICFNGCPEEGANNVRVCGLRGGIFLSVLRSDRGRVNGRGWHRRENGITRGFPALLSIRHSALRARHFVFNDQLK